MKLVYNIEDRPSSKKVIVFAFQQVLAIMAATIAVPLIIGNGMSTAAALFGAGTGTFIYILFTARKSPVFLGSSFAFIGSMSAAFAGAASLEVGYLGLIIGAVFAGLVYVIFAIIVKKIGVGWIDRLMPAVVIGPTVSIIGLSLASSAVSNLQTSSVTGEQTKWAVLCGLIALIATMLCSTYG
ncbi:MAG: uracil-xanthine permease, partial [Erysipelotrichia bacterium]|nr:uracil-xanthine permease [Erysipelotrichia bacterium]